MTSANKSEEPIAIGNAEAFRRLGSIADFFLNHNRDIYQRCDDSIVRLAAGSGRFLRRSRGYVPSPVFLGQKVPPILACGAELKNTVCLTKGDQAFLSQHIGDLENMAAFEYYQQAIEHLQRILDISPECMAHDLHPDYLSSQFAMQNNAIPRVGVQHHHAHIVSCMAENHVAGPVIGLALDGTGFGSDGAIWGGEVLIADEAAFTRAGHIAYTRMPGAAAAIKEPWRMAVSYLDLALGDRLWTLELPFFKKIAVDNIKMIQKMVRQKINAPQTSSLGRLFDGVAAIIGIQERISFEGQAAMALEMLAAEEDQGEYEYQWTGDLPRQLLPQPIIQGVVADYLAGLAPAVISRKFHTTLISAFADICGKLRREERLKKVVLSGGVFQNVLLLEGLKKRLEKMDFDVITHRLVPTNDGGISLGQAVVAANSANASAAV
jgi:hydrogenase maturation protein HypF